MDARIILGAIVVGLCSCAIAPDKAGDITEIENERKYGVAYCLSNTYPSSKFASDSGHIAGAYLQKGNFGTHVYDSVRNYVDSYREKAYISKHGKNLDIMQCLDLYDSNSLEVVIRQAVNAP